ncbi:MAG: hypothetical protein BroJett040_25500 [Oligoflexia bacterium]|nr:MAG: hypothetical protein BroJett040_25500 [Oligoflexia bacterium]
MKNEMSSPLRNQSGQLVIEAVLLIVVMVGAALFLTSKLREMEYIQGLTSKPWSMLSGMIECGAWKPCGKGSPAAGLHPSTSNRVSSLDTRQRL